MKHLLIILIYLTTVGCVPAGVDSRAAYWRGRGAAVVHAAAVTFGDIEPTPSPDDGPSPTPATCQRCNGTGKIKPDGRIEIPCPDCQRNSSEPEQAVAEPPTPPPAPAVYWHGYLPLAKAEAERAAKPLLIYVSSETDCPACRKLEADHFPREEAIKSLSDFVCVKLQAEGEWPGGGTIAEKLGAAKIPYFVIAKPDGSVTFQGAVEPAQFDSWLKEQKP